MKTTSLSIFIVLLLASCSTPLQNENGVRKAKKITIDGQALEDSWNRAEWKPIDELWIGDPVSEQDFSGRYKLLWSEKYLYVYAEIEDDTLIDIHEDGLVKYWDDDCLEVFIDEDASGGKHQYSHNAWAYHMALDGKTVDYGPDSLAHYYDHVNYKRVTTETKSTWELAFSLYDDQYQDSGDNIPVNLSEGKKIGFAIAYCDNDHSPERENFIGSIAVAGKKKI